jgi:hypothetical protein
LHSLISYFHDFVAVLKAFKVLGAIVERALVRRALASIKEAALTATVGPAKTFRDCDFGAVGVPTLGAPAMRPAKAPGFASTIAAVYNALDRAA